MTTQQAFSSLRNLVLLLVMLLPTWIPRLPPVLLGRRDGRAAPEVDVYAAGVVLGAALQPQLAAHLLDLGLELLDVAGRVVALAGDGVQVWLAAGLVGADALLEDALGLVDKLAVQVDGVGLDLARRVVLAEDVLGRLLVVLVHLGLVPLALVGQLLGRGAAAQLVDLAGLQTSRTRTRRAPQVSRPARAAGVPSTARRR